MTHPEENPFGDFENDFKNTKEAEHGQSLGTVPEGPYKVACCAQDISGNGVLVDHEVFAANSGTKGFKLFFEILSPDSVKDKNSGEMVKTKGEIIEHVFWITQKNLGYVKRDLKTITGKTIDALSALTKMVWIGKTCEVGVKHELYRGFNQSRVAYFNAWNPDAKKGGPKGSDAASTAPATSAAAPAGGAAPGKEPEGDPNF